MRIVGGSHKGRRLAVPEGRVARPTGDRAREALFNILAHTDRVELDGAVVLDCFAGSGALGLEALSRGAARVLFMENHPDSLAAIKTNLAMMGKAADILRVDATKPPPAREPCNLVFLDAPYNSGLSAPCLTALSQQGWLVPGALCIVEVAADEPFTPPEGFAAVDERSYGAAKMVFVVVV